MPRRESDDIDKQIGQNLFKWRSKLGVSRDCLGAALNTPVSPQAVLKYEAGTTRIPSAALVELSRLLGCRLMDLFDGVEELLPKGIEALPHQQAAISNITNALIMDIARKEVDYDKRQ